MTPLPRPAITSGWRRTGCQDLDRARCDVTRFRG